MSMLKQWIEREGEDASIANLVQSLLDVELPHIVFRVYPKLLPNQYKKKVSLLALYFIHCILKPKFTLVSSLMSTLLNRYNV